MPKSKKDPLRMTESNGNRRASIDLICPPHDIKMGIRQSVDDALDFSVLLFYLDSNKRTYILRRYNGDHGKHTDPLTSEVIWGPHIHKITEECQRTFHKDEGHAEATGRYHTLEQAIEVFMSDMNICYEARKNQTSITNNNRW